jgi:hypothetical protein
VQQGQYFENFFLSDLANLLTLIATLTEAVAGAGNGSNSIRRAGDVHVAAHSDPVRKLFLLPRQPPYRNSSHCLCEKEDDQIYFASY